MKRVGTIKGIAVYEDPACPPGQLYFLNDRNMVFHTLHLHVSRWQKVKLWIKRHLS